jgi:hypothetical protein
VQISRRNHHLSIVQAVNGKIAKVAAITVSARWLRRARCDALSFAEPFPRVGRAQRL